MGFNLGLPRSIWEGSGLYRSGISRYGHELEELGSFQLMTVTVPMPCNSGKLVKVSRHSNRTRLKKPGHFLSLDSICKNEYQL